MSVGLGKHETEDGTLVLRWTSGFEAFKEVEKNLDLYCTTPYGPLYDLSPDSGWSTSGIAGFYSGKIVHISPLKSLKLNIMLVFAVNHNTFLCCFWTNAYLLGKIK